MRSLPLPAATPMLRTFVAVELSAAAKRQVQEIQRLLRQALESEQLSDLFRWTSADNLHLTLRFLGDTTGAQQAHLEGALAELAHVCPAFHLSVRRPGAFPNLRKPNIIWLDFAGQLHLLASLQAQIERAAQGAGFGCEERAFVPHLTIMRAQKSASPHALARAGELLFRQTALLLPPADPFLVSQILLIRSDLHPSGAVYQPLAAFRLAAGAAG